MVFIDLPACGMRAFFYWGVCQSIGTRFIERIYGRSSGAIVGAFILCGTGPEDLERIYGRVSRLNRDLRIVDAFCKVLMEELPSDAHECCTGRLFVTCAFLGVFPWTTSEFSSRSHLVECIRASGRVPWITTSGPRGLCDLLFLDGGLVDWCFRPRLQSYIRVVAPRDAWPQYWLPVAANLPLAVVQHAIDLGRRSIDDNRFVMLN